VPGTLIFFESAQRLRESLADMADILGPRDAAVARELTKRYEEIRRGSLTELAAHYREAGAPRGEVAIVIGPPVVTAPTEDDLDTRLRELLIEHSVRDAVALLTSATGLPRRALYERALALQGSDEEIPQ
jgi:16S rRNA (cytidine1402-2'-O)-methyltransferase